MAEGKAKLRGQRDKAVTLTASLNARLKQYQEKQAAGEQILAEARRQYQADPDAMFYYLAGKRLTPSEFDYQVQFTASELAAITASIHQLQTVRNKERAIWDAMAKATGEFELKRAQLETARIAWETDRIVTGLNIDFHNAADALAQSGSVIRDIDQLLSDTRIGDSQISLETIVAESDAQRISDGTKALLEDNSSHAAE